MSNSVNEPVKQSITNPVGWFEIYVQEMERAKKFYQAVFAVELQPVDMHMPGMEMWMFPADQSRPGTTGALVKMKGVASGGGGTLVYFSCEDCAVQQRLAAASGGVVVHQKFSIGDKGFVSMVRDTEQNLIGLHSLK